MHHLSIGQFSLQLHYQHLLSSAHHSRNGSSQLRLIEGKRELATLLSYCKPLGEGKMKSTSKKKSYPSKFDEFTYLYLRTILFADAIIILSKQSFLLELFIIL